MSESGGGSALRKLRDVASFVLAWSLMLHQAWLTQHGAEPNEWIIMFAAAIIAPSALQYVAAIRSGSSTPPGSQRSEASSSSSSSSDGPS